MYCPACGAQNSTKQKFCRSCGLNLEASAASLIQQVPIEEVNRLKRQEQLLEKFGTVAFGGFGLVLFAGIGALVYFIVLKMIAGGIAMLFGFLLISFIVFAALTLAYVIFAETLKDKRKKLNPNAPPNLAPEPILSLEEGNFEPVPSVTEDTTDLLIEKSRTRKLN